MDDPATTCDAGSPRGPWLAGSSPDGIGGEAQSSRSLQSRSPSSDCNIGMMLATAASVWINTFFIFVSIEFGHSIVSIKGKDFVY
ncbi:hypothetical protein [Bradyrhizobium erythrophlei]|uniref:hypothetical protein n=1 Tax=Bradyrhizobium erythrophlei TaxID=1437360 RepID=UPI0012ABAACC|nr:hypothetical protein [Bradyrhizobium erythrophlei]